MNARRATDKMLAFARDIANTLDIDMPTTKNASGDEIADESFDAIHNFIEEHEADFYEWRRDYGAAILGALVAICVGAMGVATLLLAASIVAGRPMI